MKNYPIKLVSVLILCLSITAAAFTACSSGKKEAEKAPADEKTDNSLTWFVKPNIEADEIMPFVRADFNENTNHYDISYDSVFRVKLNGKYGIIDFNGGIVVPAEFDELFAVRGGDDYIGVKNTSSGKKQTYIHNDTYKTEPAYKKYNSVKYEYYWLDDESKAVFVKNDDGNIKEKKLNASLPETVAGAIKITGDYKFTGEYGLLSNGKPVTGMIYTASGCFSDGIVAFESNGKWGYVNSDGKTIIPFGLDAVKGYSALGGKDTPYESYDGFVTVCKNGNYAIYTNKGEAQTEFIYSAATPVVDGKAFVKMTGLWGVVTVDSDKNNAGNTEKQETTTEKTTTTVVTFTKPVRTAKFIDEPTSEKEVTDRETNSASSGSYTITVGEGGSLNLRSAPDTDSSIISSIPDGTRVYVDEISNGWGHTAIDGHEGWFSLKYAEKG